MIHKTTSLCPHQQTFETCPHHQIFENLVQEIVSEKTDRKKSEENDLML